MTTEDYWKNNPDQSKILDALLKDAEELFSISEELFERAIQHMISSEVSQMLVTEKLIARGVELRQRLHDGLVELEKTHAPSGLNSSRIAAWTMFTKNRIYHHEAAYESRYDREFRSIAYDFLNMLDDIGFASSPRVADVKQTLKEAAERSKIHIAAAQ